jgi:hypothetical protein
VKFLGFGLAGVVHYYMIRLKTSLKVLYIVTPAPPTTGNTIAEISYLLAGGSH